MTSASHDRLLGGVLLVIAIAWLVAAEYAVPEGYSGSHFGPRTFPLTLGVMLAVLSLVMLAETFLRSPDGVEAADEDSQTTRREEVWSSFATFGFLVVYLGAMQVFGFVVATAVTVAAFLWLVLRKRSLFLVGGMSLGLAFGLWLAMERFLGVLLPAGMLGWGF